MLRPEYLGQGQVGPNIISLFVDYAKFWRLMTLPFIYDCCCEALNSLGVIFVCFLNFR